eukprot:TRINITY_DN49596_c0_g1_i1.p1 TRINITY_DN49596_c0_g1~~TRINITY_DN49596_c0_g1_i1.p1  ORF type:complete len:243 (-),score=66.13 TRINITY_DN49596_c0_g1_i1:76-804(-)
MSSAAERQPILAHAEAGDLSAVKALLEEASEADCKKRLKARDEDERTAFHRACAAGHTEVAAYLLSKGAKADVADEEGWTPLHSCASKGADNLVSLLVDGGADCDAETSSGTTALHLASSKGHEGVVQLLLAANAKVNSKDRNGGTPLLRAVGAGRTQAVKLLLNAQADVRCKDRSGENVFHVVINGLHVDLCELLFERDEAEKLMTQENGDGKTAAQMLLDLAPVEVRDKMKSIWREKRGG